MSLQAGIVEVARACIDTPFRHQGRIAGVGLDCAGLCVFALRSCGVEVRDVKAYGPIPNEGRLLQAIDAQPGLSRVPLSEAGLGDVVLLRMGREPSHVGILTDPGYIIHAFQVIGRVVEHRLDEVWQPRMVAAWRARGEA